MEYVSIFIHTYLQLQIMLCYTYIYEDFYNTIYKLNGNHIWHQDQPSKENT